MTSQPLTTISTQPPIEDPWASRNLVTVRDAGGRWRSTISSVTPYFTSRVDVEVDRRPESEGVASFGKSFNDVLAVLDLRRRDLTANHAGAS